jgi:hypothetical protein
MDPYLEELGGWKGVHGRLIAIFGEVLNRDLGPRFIADGDTRVYVVSPAEQQWIFTDLYVVETPRPVARSGPRGGFATPVRVSLSEPTTIEQPYIIIRDRATRQVVTIVELLSPINKVSAAPTGALPAARADFLQKRRLTMASTTHWVEIDLLRAGERPVEVRTADPGPYYAACKRAGAAELEVWPISLHDPLPAIGVPLPPPEEEVGLDLQAALDLLFERYRYAELLDYRRPPPAPSFALDDARWLADHVERWRAAGADPNAEASSHPAGPC